MIIKKKSTKIAFTLAEVLVTLGIIGVVSAMTIPTLINTYQRKSYVTQLHKVYNELQQAIQMCITEHNALTLTEAGVNNDDDAGKFVKDYFKIVQDCGNEPTPCFPTFSQYKKLSGTNISVWIPKRHFVLANGVSVATKYNSSTDLLIEYWVDINGVKGPNIVGRDFFLMYIYRNGAIDDLDYSSLSAPRTSEQRELNFKTHCNSNSSTTYHGCFGKILNDNWQMTY